MQRLLLVRWHRLLRLERQAPSWYRERLREELLERREALTPLQRLSETADVFYILSRAVHDGYPLQSVPPFKPIRHILVYAYMVSKYTSRWLFYRVAAKACRSANAGQVREVINPAKKHKVGEVASRHALTRSICHRPDMTSNMATTTVSQASAATVATDIGSDPASDKKPVIIGLYGLPGSGKSTLMKEIKLQVGHESFLFYEGSELISTLVAGGLAAFEKLDQQQKRLVRERAMTSVTEECLAQNRAALVVGHYMFWPEGEAAGDVVITARDLGIYTHIIYLKVPVDAIRQRRLGDTHRHRQPVSTAHLEQWQSAEIDQLHGLCRQHCILFTTIPPHSEPFPFALKLVRHFEQTNARRNLALVMSKVKVALEGEERAETVLVVDADKTLAGDDAGSMFWQAANGSSQDTLKMCPLKNLFSSPLGYSEAAFRQATLLYEEATNETDFEALCEKIASSITLHPEFITLFRLACSHGHIRVVVLTCGIRRVWQIVLDKAGLGHSIKVVGGGRITDEVVMTPETKARVVSSLREQSGLYVWAFGDSTLDLPMLEAANRAIVVSGDTRNRSCSMESALCEAIDALRLCPRQVLLPPHATPRLDATTLPLLAFSDADFVQEIVRRRGTEANATVSRSAPTCSGTVVHATDTGAARLLMSPTRDASKAGAELRLAHEEVGKYLALRYLTEVIGVENFHVPHVQGHQTTGFRLAHESQTTIIALMRGGEPMAFGISRVFPRAMFLHAFGPEDIKHHHLENQKNLILVDSVVNSGKSIMDFLRHVARLKQNLTRIVVVAGVVQKEAVADGHALRTEMEQHQVNMVALRVSDNKFTGTKTTDTGNRLFNTTHLA
ncbi:uracil phosphoribosyltransferase [Cordyceps militaris]|uniref:Uracil phosphoribosyltransferase n=1 Tax=Cordyceps militaris TaxID=73501 RepID=A0A2H4SR72_CORMI|nr:uracil phosphoribosyltransferase [Cordyceps militaris]